MEEAQKSKSECLRKSKIRKLEAQAATRYAASADDLRTILKDTP
jgi:hypothetical protein